MGLEAPGYRINQTNGERKDKIQKLRIRTAGIIALSLSLIVLTAFTVSTSIAGAGQNIVLTDTAPDTTITAGTSATVYGSSGVNHITVAAGADVELVNFPGSNIITIAADSSGFTVSRSGAVVTFQGTDGTVVKLPATGTLQTVSFDDGDLELTIKSGAVMLDDQVISNASASIEALESIPPEIVQILPSDTDSISVAWLPASSPDLTGFVYEVHLDTTEGFVPSSSTLKQEISGDL